MATMLSFAWGAMCERVRHRPLEEAEAKELASAVIPVANKYGGGFLDKWSAEITLVLVCWGLWENTALPEAPAPAAPPPGETTQ